MYGILRAPKAASTEAIVLSVPYRSMHAEGDKTAAGIALMLGLAKAFRSKYRGNSTEYRLFEHHILLCLRVCVKQRLSTIKVYLEL